MGPRSLDAREPGKGSAPAQHVDEEQQLSPPELAASPVCDQVEVTVCVDVHEQERSRATRTETDEGIDGVRWTTCVAFT